MAILFFTVFLRPYFSFIHKSGFNFFANPFKMKRGKLRLRANGRNNSQHCCAKNVGSCCMRVSSGVQTNATTPNKCIMGKTQPSLCNPCVMSVRGPNNVGRAEETDLTLLHDVLVITEQNKCWEWLAEKFDRFQTLRNNTQQHATGCANGRNM